MKNIRQKLVFKLIIAVGITLLLSLSAWAYFNIRYQKDRVMQNIVASSDRLTNTIKLGTQYAMMNNSRDDINQIINNIGTQKEINKIRIYNKEGQIKYSNRPSEVDQSTNIKDEACYICHRTEPPLVNLPLEERIRIFNSSEGQKLLGIISPIYNEPGCSTACHFHPEQNQVLGALDVVVSLEDVQREILSYEKGVLGITIFVFLITSAIVFIFVHKFVNRPVLKLIKGTQLIGKGEHNIKVDIDQEDEMGQLAKAICQMGKEICRKQSEINKQRDEYQNLFELVPCLITVQDRNYKLIKYNREFEEKFHPLTGDYCYHAYKGRDRKCTVCPVEKTFEDGGSYVSEEIGYGEDGTARYWFVRTSPIRDSEGKIVAAMEMSLDITERKHLEYKLEKSEKKYHAIFDSIPNPVFVLDINTFDILDCNESVKSVYGFKKSETLNKNFLDLFKEDNREDYAFKLSTSSVISQVKQTAKDGRTIYVNIRLSPSEYSGQKVLLVTTSDITKRLEAEQQLIQTSKLATLGEMSTGVAHELNQPLSVIKTVSSFFVKKIDKQEEIEKTTLYTMLRKVDSNVDRAARIINHMRQFARKSDLSLAKIQVNDVLDRAFDIFSQQLKVRGIEVVKEISGDLPPIKADAVRLEQVFINLLLNARDVLEECWDKKTRLALENGEEVPEKKIYLRTYRKKDKVVIEIEDTGEGIPQRILEKVFEPFFTTKQVGKGTGLGLSISYGIVKDCGGEIRVVSPEGKGACFILSFPVPAEDIESKEHHE
ncbi:MAG: PAS domain S-box protein [Desulfobacterales bacterium]